jgi:predicted MFS family arabinose efflux permease
MKKVKIFLKPLPKQIGRLLRLLCLFLVRKRRMRADSNDASPLAIAAGEQEPMRRSMVWLIATSVSVVVANIYYAQPLLADIAHSFGLTVTQAGAIAMLSQVGTAVGMFLFVPLGDKFERRSLITILMLGGVASLLLFAVAPNVVCLAAASFAVGAFAANVHVVVPFAAHLASDEQRGRVVGTMVGGILFGVLLARTFSGWIGALFGWRAVYGIASVGILILAAIMRAQLPASLPALVIAWPDLMRSKLHLVRRHALLRESALLGAMCFSAFSAFWTTLIFFLESPAYRYGSAVAGFFGLVGAVGAAGAPTFGHLAWQTRASCHHPRGAVAQHVFLHFDGIHWQIFCRSHYLRDSHGSGNPDRPCLQPDPYLQPRPIGAGPAQHGLHVLLFRRRRPRLLPWRRLLASWRMVGRLFVWRRDPLARYPSRIILQSLAWAEHKTLSLTGLPKQRTNTGPDKHGECLRAFYE